MHHKIVPEVIVIIWDVIMHHKIVPHVTNQCMTPSISCIIIIEDSTRKQAHVTDFDKGHVPFFPWSLQLIFLVETIYRDPNAFILFLNI